MKSSAPGKIILFGEHAVVYGCPALAVPVTQVQAEVEVLHSSQPGIRVHSPAINLNLDLSELPEDNPVAYLIHKFFSSQHCSSSSIVQYFNGVDIHIRSTIPVSAGLGSGAAVSVALLRALSHYLNISLSNEEINELAYETEKLHHGTPSGIDNTVITYAMPVYFVKGHPIETFEVAKPFTIVIADTGIIAPTRDSVRDVNHLWLQDPARINRIFAEISKISSEGRRLIESGQTDALGELMNQNHACLQTLTVSCPELDHLVQQACRAGASGAKLSGSGRGGNMIALVSAENAHQVASALLTAGAKHVIVTVVK